MCVFGDAFGWGVAMSKMQRRNRWGEASVWG